MFILTDDKLVESIINLQAVGVLVCLNKIKLIKYNPPISKRFCIDDNLVALLFTLPGASTTLSCQTN